MHLDTGNVTKGVHHGTKYKSTAFRDRRLKFDIIKTRGETSGSRLLLDKPCRRNEPINGRGFLKNSDIPNFSLSLSNITLHNYKKVCDTSGNG